MSLKQRCRRERNNDVTLHEINNKCRLNTKEMCQKRREVNEGIKPK